MEVFAGGHTIYSQGGARSSGAVVRREAVPVANRSWTLELWASSDGIAQLRVLVMAFGLLVTVSLYGAAATARTSQDRAALLGKANAALHAEVRMRQRVEQRVSELNVDLRRRLSEFETLLDVLPIGIAVADDAACSRIWTNPALAKMMGIPEGINISKSAPGHDQPKYRLRRDGLDVPPDQLPMQVAARTGRAVLADELEIVRADGGVLHTLSYSAPVFDENGRVRGVLDACVDITERIQLLEREQAARQDAERALAALRASESNFRRLIDSDVIGIVVVEANRLVDANECFAQLIGIPREELRSGAVTWHDITPGECREDDEQRLRRLLSEKRMEALERELVRRDGAPVPVLIGAAQLENAGDWKAICFVLDQTGRKKLERRLRRAEKLNSLARMAGGIAHDFNNLLTGILGNASLASDFLAADDQVQPILSEIMKSSNRAAELVAQILAYTGRALRHPQSLNLSEIVRQAEPQLARMAGDTAQLHLELAEDLPPVHADREQVSQVLANLASNAVEALPSHDGHIQIRTGVCEISSDKAVERFPDQELRAGLYVRLEVSDNGHGIPDDVAAQMFDPFFTTRFVGRGLGLSAVQGVVRAHGGGIRVSTSADAGTRFEVVFPAADRISELSTAY
jgi:PAS domain S-box-containing protein